MAEQDEIYNGNKKSENQGVQKKQGGDDDGFAYVLECSPLRLAVFKNTYESGDVEYSANIERNYYKGDDAPEDDKWGQTPSIPAKHAAKASKLWDRFFHEEGINKRTND